MTTMRRLVLVRHAKSAWDDPTLDDHDRPLAPRGEKALAKMRTHLATLDLPSLLVLCSTARRAVATFDGIRGAIPDASLVSERSIYDAGHRALLAGLRSVPDSFESAMVVGHNPTVQDLALTLVGSGNSALRDQLSAKLPTGAIVTLVFEGAWNDLAPDECVLDGLFVPRAPRS